jgi:hypothetical protein
MMWKESGVLKAAIGGVTFFAVLILGGAAEFNIWAV